ncbi:MAG TPA: hypothetical protein VEY93_03025 [Longimicrobium sp.]|nr:hypothetical protein [Longimicrobium sp.]
MENRIELALTVLVAVVSTPESIRAEAVTLACQGVSVWARERGKLGTALLFAQAAALASPQRSEPPAIPPSTASLSSLS